jgi:hypothetical protein
MKSVTVCSLFAASHEIGKHGQGCLPYTLEIRTAADLAGIKIPLLQTGRSVTSEILPLTTARSKPAGWPQSPSAPRTLPISAGATTVSEMSHEALKHLLHREGVLRRGLLRVKSLPADYVIYTAEDLQKADRVASAPRKEKVCEQSCPRAANGQTRQPPRTAINSRRFICPSCGRRE